MYFSKIQYHLTFIFLTSLYSPVSHAIDNRNVIEPTTPSACTTVYARNTVMTDDIQKALNNCSVGKAVKLSNNGSMNLFLSGPITMPNGVSLIIDKGTVLRAVNNANTFDNGSKNCGTLNGDGKGCKALITFYHVSNGGIYGKGEIDGQGGQILNDKMLSWWDLAQQAKSGSQNQNAPRLIQVESSENIKLYQITLKNAPKFHAVFSRSSDITVWNIKINTPANARNTDGLDFMSSNNVTVASSNISTGDDNIAIKASGGNGSSTDMSFLNNIFGSGHGFSIGSETKDGVYNIYVNGLTMKGTDNGLRIKGDRSQSGEVSNIQYNNVNMSNVKNSIIMDTVYENKSGSTKANWHDVIYNEITVFGQSNIIFNGTNAIAPLKATMTNMHLPDNIMWNIKNTNINK
ncbi:endopolygalacturonase [Acinetobacter sp. FNA3]|nr:endopolygalacturonase [Acinetobacter pollinis]MBF7693945.1 endopolygalacturonase [Acinetobacter pollinis]MBF7699051.1 endopolygalacturonase [Acinetobacter pollinis]MBF7701600.1 endopolygalacturonase [Acinetobacter pollinis]